MERSQFDRDILTESRGRTYHRLDGTRRDSRSDVDVAFLPVLNHAVDAAAQNPHLYVNLRTTVYRVRYDGDGELAER